MKVLFVSSGNTENQISPIVKAQAESLKSKGVDIHFYPIVGKGIMGYLKHVLPLRVFISKMNFDVIHSHYSLCGVITSLTMTKIPKIVSLMGSDVEVGFPMRNVIKILHKKSWKNTIVKSYSMKEKLPLQNLQIIPNGVNFEVFKPEKQYISKKKVQFDSDKKYVLWISSPNRPEKNFDLAEKAIALLNSKKYILKVLDNVKHDKIPAYLNASDVLLLTSFREGSPNVIKEAMACNIPIVSTNVGDVKTTIGQTEGCFITNFDSNKVSKFILKAIEYNKRTNGRMMIKSLDSKVIAEKLITLYSRAVK